MSVLSSMYRRGAVSALVGLALVAYGVVGSARIMLVLGVGLLVWGVVRHKSSSRRSSPPREPAGDLAGNDPSPGTRR